MTLPISTRLNEHEAQGEARLLREHLLNPTSRKLVIEMFKDYVQGNETAKEAIRQHIHRDLAQVTSSQEILYSLVMGAALKIVDDHPEVDVITILQNQPNHHWWYDLIDSLANAERLTQHQDYSLLREQYSNMDEQVFQLTLLSSEAQYKIMDLLGYEKGTALLSRFYQIRDEVGEKMRKISKNPLLDFLNGVSYFDLALAILRKRLKDENQNVDSEVFVEIFAKLEQMLVANERISILRRTDLAKTD